MEIIRKQIEQKSVEITEQQFSDLTADLTPSSVDELFDITRSILEDCRKEHPETKMKAMERCRRFLNTHRMLRELMIAFKEEAVSTTVLSHSDDGYDPTRAVSKK